MMRPNPANLVIGILLVVFGALLVLNRIGLGPFLPYAGIVLVILGALMLARVVAGGTLVAIVSIVAGALLMSGFWSLPRPVGDWLWVVNMVLGIILLVFGIQRLIGRPTMGA
jgi:hypothetical protein